MDEMRGGEVGEMESDIKARLGSLGREGKEW